MICSGMIAWRSSRFALQVWQSCGVDRDHFEIRMTILWMPCIRDEAGGEAVDGSDFFDRHQCLRTYIAGMDDEESYPD